MTDYRTRCPRGHLICDACQCCNGCDTPENAPTWSGSYPSGINGLGKITTDRDGRTWHAECRYERTGAMA